MEFTKTQKMRISVLKEQEKYLTPKRKIKKHLQNDNNIAFDIIHDEKIIGFVLIRKFDDGCFFLWDYAIDKNFQNQHLGTIALNELIEFMKKEYGMHTMTTTYTYGNSHAKALYEKQGFAETDVVNEKGVHEVNMIYKIDC